MQKIKIFIKKLFLALLTNYTQQMKTLLSPNVIISDLNRSSMAQFVTNDICDAL